MSRYLAGLLWCLGAVVALAAACQYAKPACDVVKVADEACGILLVVLPDGGTEQVPRAELVKLATARRTMRLAAEHDAGQ